MILFSHGHGKDQKNYILRDALTCVLPRETGFIMDREDRILKTHLFVGTTLFLVLAGLDIYLTLKGTAGNLAMEGNPVMRFMMSQFGHLGGLLIEKSLVLAVVIILGVKVGTGIKEKKNWVYYLALTPMTRRWMKRKRRFFVAYVPLYLVDLGQAVAVGLWFLLIC